MITEHQERIFEPKFCKRFGKTIHVCKGARFINKENSENMIKPTKDLDKWVIRI